MATTGNAEKESIEGEENSRGKYESEDDLRLLLECLQFQRHSVPAQKQALTTIATMCSNSSSSRNLFNSTGGLAFVLDLLYSTRSPEILQASLYTLGCASENNVINQLKLCNERLFSFLADLLMAQPNETSSLPVPIALIIAIAFLAGCLMSNNGQGQNMARENKLLTRLIFVFKSFLPSTYLVKAHSDGASAANQCVNQSHSYRLWSSVCSALCTATNNPQNETNQCLCTRLFPAALSVLDLVPLNPDVLRPAISFLASCVATNRTAQDRLRMVGGLQSLVKTLRVVVTQANSTQEECQGNVAEMFELALHIVKTLSAAAFGHSANCKSLVDFDCVKLLLALLRHDGLSQSTKLNVVLCLGMLTEDNAVGQCQLTENDGMCLLVEVMASSQSEELSKATTFVLQCCVYRNKPQDNSTQVENVELMNKIAMIEKLLQANQQSPDSKLSSEGSVACRSINQEGLELLDSHKLPVNERVFTWLTNSVPEEQTEPTVNELQKDILKTVDVNTQLKKCDDSKETLCNDKIMQYKTRANCEQMMPKDVPVETHVELKLQHQRTLRELKKKLAQEKENVQQLEQKLETQAQLELQRENVLREKLEKQLAREKEKSRQLEREVAESKQTSANQSSKTDVTLSNQLQNMSNVINVTPTKVFTTQTPTRTHNPSVSLSAKLQQSTGRSNIRYANSAHVYQNGIQRFIQKTKQEEGVYSFKEKPPNTCTNAYSLVEHVHKHKGKENFVNSAASSSGCDHHCLGCKPRLKCTLITSRNFVKLLRVDRFTCAYHRRFASRMMGGLKDIQSTNRPTSAFTTPQVSAASLEISEVQSSENSEQSVSTCDSSMTVSSSPMSNDIDYQHLPSPSQQLNNPSQISGCDDTVNTTSHTGKEQSDSEYIPSETSQSSSLSPPVIPKNITGNHTPIKNILDVSTTHTNPSKHGKSLVPKVYKLVPGSCKPACNQVKQTLQHRSKSNVLKDVTNQTVQARNPLTVFDYSTPDGKAGDKYLPQRSAKVSAKQMAKSFSNKWQMTSRKPRVNWSTQEEEYLKEGVELLGTGQWRHILAAYPFHPSRNSDSLRDKYRNSILPSMRKLNNH